MLVMGEHAGAAELEISLVRPVGIDKHDPLVRVALTDLVPRESLGVAEDSSGFVRAHDHKPPPMEHLVKFCPAPVVSAGRSTAGCTAPPARASASRRRAARCRRRAALPGGRRAASTAGPC